MWLLTSLNQALLPSELSFHALIVLSVKQEAVLKELETEGGVIAFGFSFLGTQPKLMPIKGMASKILCEAHNSALSPLDLEAGRFFKYSLNLALNYHQAPSISIFAGEDIELWLLKTLLGVYYSGTIQFLSHSGLSKRNLSIDLDLIKILFQQQEWPQSWGLYLTEGVYPNNGHFLMDLKTDQDKVSGAYFRFCGKQFFLSFGAS